VTNRRQRACELSVRRTAHPPAHPTAAAVPTGWPERCRLAGSRGVGTPVGAAAPGAGWWMPERDGEMLLGGCQARRPGLVGQAGAKQDQYTPGLCPVAHCPEQLMSPWLCFVPVWVAKLGS